MSSEARSQLRDFAGRRFPDGRLADDQDIFDSGYVNSLFAMELVMFIEQLVDDRIPNDELRLDNFRTVDTMIALIGRMTAADPSAAARGVA